MITAACIIGLTLTAAATAFYARMAIKGGILGVCGFEGIKNCGFMLELLLTVISKANE